MRPISRFVAHLTGIDDRMVRDAPTIDEVLPSFLEFARGAILVAHNASFDLAYLHWECHLADIALPKLATLCTCDLARDLWEYETRGTRAPRPRCSPGCARSPRRLSDGPPRRRRHRTWQGRRSRLAFQLGFARGGCRYCRPQQGSPFRHNQAFTFAGVQFITSSNMCFCKAAISKAALPFGSCSMTPKP